MGASVIRTLAGLCSLSVQPYLRRGTHTICPPCNSQRQAIDRLLSPRPHHAKQTNKQNKKAIPGSSAKKQMNTIKKTKRRQQRHNSKYRRAVYIHKSHPSYLYTILPYECLTPDSLLVLVEVENGVASVCRQVADPDRDALLPPIDAIRQGSDSQFPVGTSVTMDCALLVALVLSHHLHIFNIMASYATANNERWKHAKEIRTRNFFSFSRKRKKKKLYR